MKVATAAAMREIDRRAIEEFGIPGTVLMGYAGKALAGCVLADWPAARRIAVCAGTGNNGGDGFTAAYLLAQAGCQVDLFLAGAEEKVSETSRCYFELCKKTGIGLRGVEDDIPGSLERGGYDLAIDALLGTGFTGQVREPFLSIIRTLNRLAIPVVAADIPSGLPADGAAPEGEAIRASATVTMGLPKVSLVTWPGMDYCGKLVVADIGFPRVLTESDAIAAELADDAFASAHLPRPVSADLYKYERGHLLLIGGFHGMEGAIVMTARAALETGVGLVTILTDEEARARIAGLVPEAMTAGIGAEIRTREAVDAFLDSFFRQKRYDAVVIGPGLGREERARHIFGHLAERLFDYGVRRLLIDGDGLFHCASWLEGNGLDERVGYVITPHLVEASRLSRTTVDAIRRDRMRAALDLARQTTAVTLLKGPGTIITDGERTCINTTGNPALATAGTGDLLSGIIGALMLRNEGLLESAALGAYIHGKAADRYCAEEGVGHMKATDLLAYIKKVYP